MIGAPKRADEPSPDAGLKGADDVTASAVTYRRAVSGEGVQGVADYERKLQAA
jgi:hypothetical protein